MLRTCLTCFWESTLVGEGNKLKTLGLWWPGDDTEEKGRERERWETEDWFPHLLRVWCTQDDAWGAPGKGKKQRACYVEAVTWGGAGEHARTLRTLGPWGRWDAGVCAKTTAGRAGFPSCFFGHRISATSVAVLCFGGESTGDVSTVWFRMASAPNSLCQNLPTLQKDPKQKIQLIYCILVQSRSLYNILVIGTERAKNMIAGIKYQADVSCVSVSECCKIVHYLWFGSTWIYLEFNLRGELCSGGFH